LQGGSGVVPSRVFHCILASCRNLTLVAFAFPLSKFELVGISGGQNDHETFAKFHAIILRRISERFGRLLSENRRSLICRGFRSTSDRSQSRRSEHDALAGRYDARLDTADGHGLDTGHPLNILSRQAQRAIERRLRRHQHFERFDRFEGLEQYGTRVPAEVRGLAGDRVAVGDSPTNADRGTNAGISPTCSPET
jgi:hypothetical protein